MVVRWREALDAPLPPLQLLPPGSQDEAAAALAREVLAGGDGSLPALLTALQAAGIGVRTTDGVLEVEPAQPGQGLVFETWEVRAMADLAGSEHQVLVPFANFAEVLAGAMPELAGAPLQELILDGIRTHAAGNQPTMRFWASFIVELGRQAETHEPYDLLGEVNPAGVYLDNVQVSLILRRLSGDLLAFSGVAQASTPAAARQGASLSQDLAYASAPLPCTLNEAQSIGMDFGAMSLTSGFDKLMGYLEKKGMQAAGKIGSVTGAANIVLTYARLAMVHAAFNIDIRMEDAPLVRPKERYLYSNPDDAGDAAKERERKRLANEQKTVAATVTMDIGKGQWVNCFRTLLNQAGMDFSLPNDGPVKGAGVRWGGRTGFSSTAAALHGGPEQIVRYAFCDCDITKQTTDDSGMSRVDVEGVVPKRTLPETVRRVTKRATLSVNITMQKANIFQDFISAGGAAIGGPSGWLTIPAELIYRTDYTLGGVYTFDVIDWEGGPPRLAGYITHRYTWPDADPPWSMDGHAEARFPGGEGEWIAGQAAWAAGQGAWTAGHGTWAAGEGTWAYQYKDAGPYGLQGCSGVGQYSGSGEGPALLIVVDQNNAPTSNPLSLLEQVDQGALTVLTIAEDGAYRIEFNGLWQQVFTKTCAGSVQVSPPQKITLSFYAEGRVDPSKSWEITGSRKMDFNNDILPDDWSQGYFRVITWSIREEG